MDPDENLKEQLKKIATFLLNESHGENNNIDHILSQADRLAELVIDLNDWIISSGFPPKAWKLKK